MKKAKNHSDLMTEGGYKLADWIFCRLIDILNDQSIEMKVIFKRLNKNTPKKAGKIYYGHLGQLNLQDDDFCIIIEPRISERSKMRVFCHELLHILFENIDDEKPVENLEHILWPMFSEPQKQMFKIYMHELARKNNLKRPN